MTISESIQPSSVTLATLLTPKADIFSSRAKRLRHLASGHSLSAWLNWLAELCQAQQSALDGFVNQDLNPGSSDSAKPLLDVGAAPLRGAWHATYRQLLAAAGSFSPMGGESRQSNLSAQTAEELDRKASLCLLLAAGEGINDRRGLSEILVAAAMQVAWTAAARQLAMPEVTHLENHEFCPCCGSAPVGSIVMAGEGKIGLRYLECSLCATRWNAVRARCTLCDDGSVVHYLGIEGGNEAVQAETCDQCHGYIKTFFQNKDVNVDPMADDLASLALDVLVGEQGYARATPNLFLIEGEAV